MANEKNLVNFKTGVDPRRNVKGRPLKITTIIKDMGYSKDDLKAAFISVGWLPLDEIKKLAEPEDGVEIPGHVMLVASAYVKGITKGDFRYVSEMLAYAIGKPTEQTENKHLHKILVEYVNPNNTVIPSASGAIGDTSEQEAI